MTEREPITNRFIHKSQKPLNYKDLGDCILLSHKMSSLIEGNSLDHPVLNLVTTYAIAVARVLVVYSETPTELARNKKVFDKLLNHLTKSMYDNMLQSLSKRKNMK